MVSRQWLQSNSLVSDAHQGWNSIEGGGLFCACQPSLLRSATRIMTLSLCEGQNGRCPWSGNARNLCVSTFPHMLECLERRCSHEAVHVGVNGTDAAHSASGGGSG